jgi:hypothetical protein
VIVASDSPEGGGIVTGLDALLLNGVLISYNDATFIYFFKVASPSIRNEAVYGCGYHVWIPVRTQQQPYGTTTVSLPMIETQKSWIVRMIPTTTEGGGLVVVVRGLGCCTC